MSKSVQLVRASSFRNDLLQNPYFNAYTILTKYVKLMHLPEIEMLKIALKLREITSNKLKSIYFCWVLLDFSKYVLLLAIRNRSAALS